jgi:hypothetical protein
VIRVSLVVNSTEYNGGDAVRLKIIKPHPEGCGFSLKKARLDELALRKCGVKCD